MKGREGTGKRKNNTRKRFFTEKDAAQESINKEKRKKTIYKSTMAVFLKTAYIFCFFFTNRPMVPVGFHNELWWLA